MTGEKLVHVIFNTGAREEIMRRNFKFPHLERANLDWVIKNAKNTAGVDIDENIILQLRVSTERNRAAFINYYEAVFYYGTYTNKETFLISYGAKNRDISKQFWPMLNRKMIDNYGISSTIDTPPATPAVVDVFVPCSHLEASTYLYKFNYYDFCARLGWAIFHPNSIKM